MLQDFKAFIMRGNVVDLAVGVIIGGAFGKIVSSITNDLFMPLVGLITGRLDFSNLFITLSGPKMASLAEAKAAAAVTLNYGQFVTAVVDFLLIALVVFILIRWINRFKKPVAVNTRTCPRCKMSVSKEATRCPYCTSEI